MRVLVIPEDFRKDQYILKPVIDAMVRAIGKPRARVEICRDPLLQGVEQALRWPRIEEILDAYMEMVDTFLLIVDRDANRARRASLDELERRAAQFLGDRGRFFAEHAWQEIEVWALAVQELPSRWKWKDIRADAHPKERYFDVIVRERGLQGEPGQGRRTLGLEAGQRYRRVRQLCPEDVAALEEKLKV